MTADRKIRCTHPDGAIKNTAPDFPKEWACTKCGQRFMPTNARKD